jgi:hypothetical protein
MHPLSVFPSLLTFGLLAPFLLRLAIGVLQLLTGIEKSKKKLGGVSVVQVISSILLIVGLYTQVVALIAILLIGIEYRSEKKAGKLSRERGALFILMGTILLSLLFTGPGFFAFDLPL